MRALAPYKTAIAHVLGRIHWLGTPLQHHALHGGHSPQLQRRAPRTWTQSATYASSSTKKTIVYKCSTCGETATQWKGRCPSCAGWNTLEKAEVYKETAALNKGGGGGASAAAAAGSLFSRPPADRVYAAAPAEAPSRMGWVAKTNLRPQRVGQIAARGRGEHWRLPLAGAAGAELARVLGGGVVPGSLILVGGDPGVGKSTLLLQVAAMLATGGATAATAPQAALSSAAHAALNGAASSSPAALNGAAPEHASDTDEEEEQAAEEQEEQPVLYVSAEESVEQVASRASRMGVAGARHLYLYAATRLAEILTEAVSLRPRAVIIDSIQTVYLDDVNGSAGSVSQVRECATALLHVAKRQGVPIFLVGHVTKTGDIAGPRVLEHIVDCVMYMEGERHQQFRLLRGIKNRYGPTDEVGVFQMGEGGLEAVPNPSASFLGDRAMGANAHACVTVMLEGTRPLLLEVQALCSRVHHQGQGPPLRMPNGISRNRLSLILAVLSKHARLRMHAVDCHTNVVGGLQLVEPATDLAVALAVAASYFERPIPREMVAIGEIGLGGELRPVNQVERRAIEAAKLGFTTIIVSAANAPAAKGRLAGLRIVPCRDIRAALQAVLGISISEKGRAGAVEEGEEEFMA